MASPKKNRDARKDNKAGMVTDRLPGNTTPANKKKENLPSSARLVSHPLLALGLTLCAILLFIALLDYRKNQIFYFSAPGDFLDSLARTSPLDAVNSMGKLGSTTAVLLFSFAGFGAFFVPVCLIVAALRTLFHRAHTIFPWRIAAMSAAFLSLATLLSLIDPHEANSVNTISLWGVHHFVPEGAGGRLGHYIYHEFSNVVFGKVGSFVIFSLIYAFCLLSFAVDNPRRLLSARIRLVRDYWEKRRERLRLRAIQRRQAAANAKTSPVANASPVTNASETIPPQPANNLSDLEFLTAPISPVFPEESPHAQIPPTTPETSPTAPTDFDTFAIPALPEESPDKPDHSPLTTALPQTIAAAETADIAAETSAPTFAAADTPRRKTAPPPHAISALTIHGEAIVERSTNALSLRKKGTYQFPPISLLNEPLPPETTIPENYQERAERLANTLSEFKIKVELGEIQTGPVITRYEVVPAPGVRVEKISGLANNIAMNLKAESVRVLAPVPGKGTVGIEVPNQNPKSVSLREIIESKAWETNKHDIPIVLGKDVTGKPIITDLARMPHCLIAGSTGSGKSVCINGIVASLAYHAGPDDIRFIMIDPKVVELQIYNKLPHMLIPVVTDPKKVPAALKWLIGEMERRYQIFARTDVKNIASFNAKLTKDKRQAELARQMDLELSPEERAATATIEVPRDDGALEIPDKKLPYIVCFIDELADLMMAAAADIETAIARLAQLARAAGIHLILATQRPSVNVITGIIKANLPCRIAFKVTSVVDSRTILDQKGAENLIGRGDMLFIPPGSAHLMRAQGAFVSEEEIHTLVEHIALCNGEPEFADDVQEIIEKTALEDSGDDAPTEGTDDPNEDPMLMKAWDAIRATKRASTSYLQRRLSIGYGRAAKIIDALEERGYIGPDNGPGIPREILKE
ncbi:MAG: DNA translocase FtsK 4TM domain-containing protein [Puniceicoccales bacterium]|jgi:S-DNA-T family DNA segregation ATPase FtsK/SpoIIIE|nr:DNA translocase FtsK 4TM domain-containing protein [Puniceicoccales bacterium]